MTRFWATAALGVATVAGATSIAIAEQKSIADALRADTTFATLFDAAQRMGLVDELVAEKEITLLAPTNQAFARLGEAELAELMKPENEQKLAAILKRHIVTEPISYSRIKGETRTVLSLDGTPLIFDATGPELLINGSRVAGIAIAAANGYVVPVDRVIDRS